jgi:hypothetical protein
VVLLTERAHGGAKTVTNLPDDSRGGDRLAEMLAHEGHNLVGNLEVRDMGVQVDAIEALEIKLHVTVEEIADPHDAIAPPPPRSGSDRDSMARRVSSATTG